MKNNGKTNIKEDYTIISESKYFDVNYYLSTNSEITNTNLDPVEHYLNIGWKKGKNPSSFFDGNAYLGTYKDVKDAGINPLIHYLKFGQQEGRIVERVTSDEPSLGNSTYQCKNMSKSAYITYRKLLVGHE